jgi:molybdenum cofactor synthesis domain-containing protein
MLPDPKSAPKTAAALVIGDEILSGKVDEANVVALARALRDLGVELRRVVVVKDDIEVIAREVRALAASHDWLFTSGGIGPTHDDVTIEAVARAFGVPVVMNPIMEKMLRDHYKEKVTEGHLRMALVPSGASLETSDAVRWPTVRIQNTWIMPGIPEVFRMKIPVIVERLRAEGPSPAFVSLSVYTKMDEGDLKPLLDAVVARFPDVAVGSYPKWMDPSYKTKLTFDGRDEVRAREARDAFVATLPAGEPQSIE